MPKKLQNIFHTKPFSYRFHLCTLVHCHFKTDIFLRVLIISHAKLTMKHADSVFECLHFQPPTRDLSSPISNENIAFFNILHFRNFSKVSVFITVFKRLGADDRQKHTNVYGF